MRGLAAPRRCGVVLPRPSPIPSRIPLVRPASGAANASTKTQRRVRGLVIVATVGVGVWAVDKYAYAEAIGRSVRVGFYGAVIAADYKLNFNPSNAEGLNALHERIAGRMSHLINRNAGLYTKLGQSLALQASILPAPYRKALRGVFDDAPGVGWDEVKKVWREEFGNDIEQCFEEVGKEPIASASIAQVHLATLDGKKVAIKIQRPAIQKQMTWDLASYKALMWTYQKLFDLPVYWVAEYVSEQVRHETDFEREGRSAERIAKHIKDDPSLRNKIVVPDVVWKWTSPRVLTTDYTPGTRLTDGEELDAKGLNRKTAMDAVLEVFAAMIFRWGWVHCDPHPGNVLVRKESSGKGLEIVLLDHGLYIPLSEKFRREYCELWRSLFVLDTNTIDRIAKGWGINNSDMFASATLLRPTKVRRDDNGKKEGQGEEDKSRYEKELRSKELLKSMLQNEQMIPRELVLLTRCMRICQANNQNLGSPSNRVNIFAHASAAGLRDTRPSLRQAGLQVYLADALREWVFKTTLLVVDLGFVVFKIRQLWYRWALGKEEGFEDLVQRQVQGMAKQEFGVDLDDEAFMG